MWISQHRFHRTGSGPAPLGFERDAVQRPHAGKQFDNVFELDENIAFYSSSSTPFLFPALCLSNVLHLSVLIIALFWQKCKQIAHFLDPLVAKLYSSTSYAGINRNFYFRFS